MPDPVPGVLAAPCSCGSGLPLAQCHGATLPTWEVDVDTPLVEFAPPAVTRKLDLAAGQSPREGFEGVDIWEGAQHVVDLQRFPWPFEDESVLELNCSHYIEHIPMEMVDCFGYTEASANDGSGRVARRGTPWRDALFAFFDECYRILVPGGWLHVQWPCHRSDRAFQDPTHRRFPTPQTMLYMNEDWRRANKLDHYNVVCNFAVGVDPVVESSMTLRSPEVAQAMMQHRWNTIVDWTAKLQKKPRLPAR